MFVLFGIADIYCRFKATANSLKVLVVIEDVGWFLIPTVMAVCLGHFELIIVAVGCVAMLALLNIGKIYRGTRAGIAKIYAKIRRI